MNAFFKVESLNKKVRIPNTSWEPALSTKSGIWKRRMLTSWWSRGDKAIWCRHQGNQQTTCRPVNNFISIHVKH